MIKSMPQRIFWLLAAMLLLPISGFCAPNDTQAAAKAAPNTALVEKRLSGHTFRYVFANTLEYFELPALHTPASAQLTLDLATTAIADADSSTLTFSLNGIPFHSERLTADEQVRRLAISLPFHLLQRGYNALGMDAYVRMSDGQPCTDEVNAAGWLQIYDTSMLSVSYHADAPSGNLSEFPYPFAPQLGRETIVTVSDAADDSELSAAVQAVALLSRRGSRASILSYGDISTQTAANILLINLNANAPQTILDAAGGAPQAGIASLTRDIDAQGRERLIILGDSPGALARAVGTLEDETLIRQANSSSLAIGPDQPLTPQSGYTVPESYTLEALGHTQGITLTGPFRQQVDIPVSLPRNRRIGSAAQITLNMRYAQNLDFRRSLLTLSVDGVPIGSHKLSLAQAQEDTFELMIPAGIALPPAFTLSLAFDLELEDLWCTRRPYEMPWAHVAPDSSLYLPSTPSNELLFSRYPAPFVSDGQLERVLFVLPDDAGAADFAGMAGVAAQLGKNITRSGGQIGVVRASAFDPQASDCNLILIGEPWRNPLIWQLNYSGLYFRFGDGYSIAPNEKIALLPEQAARLATLQLLPSPFFTGRAALVASATRSELLPLAYQYLSEDALLWKLNGDGVLISQEDQLWDYQFAPPEPARPVFETLSAASPNQAVWLVLAGGLMMILLFAVLMRWRHQRRFHLPQEGDPHEKP